MANRNHSAGEPRPCPHPKLKHFPMLCREPGCRNNYRIQTDAPSPDETPRDCQHVKVSGTGKCAVMACRNYYMKGSGGFWRDNGDELPGMSEPADFTGGETDTIPEHYYGVKIPDSLRPNWNDLRPEVAWWKNGVRDALGKGGA